MLKADLKRLFAHLGVNKSEIELSRNDSYEFCIISSFLKMANRCFELSMKYEPKLSLSNKFGFYSSILEFNYT